MCYSVCAARPFMDQCIKAGCFEYQLGFGLHLQRLCVEQIARGHSPCCAAVASTEMPFPPTNSLRSNAVLFDSSGRPLLAQRAACWGPFQSAVFPHALTCKIYDCSETKEEWDPVLSRGADIGFQIPNSCTPRHRSAVWLAEGAREVGERKRSVLV